MGRKGIGRLVALIAVVGAIAPVTPAANADPAAGLKRWGVADLYVQTRHVNETYWYDTYAIAAVQFQDPVNGTRTRGYLAQGTCREWRVHNALDKLGFQSYESDCTTTWSSQPIGNDSFELDPALASAKVHFTSDSQEERASWTTFPMPAVYPEVGVSWPTGASFSGGGAGVFQAATVTGRLYGFNLAGSDALPSFSIGYIGEGAEAAGLPSAVLRGRLGTFVTHSHRAFVTV